MYLATPRGEYRITQLFGERPSFYAQFGMDGHNGIDLVGPVKKRENYAFEAGRVIHAGTLGGYGKTIRILTDTGREWTYAHFESLSVKQGDYVQQWGYLGVQGTTGVSTGVHLHVGVRDVVGNRNNGYNGYYDPLPLIEQLRDEYMDKVKKLEEAVDELRGAVKERDADIIKLQERQQKQGGKIKDLQLKVKRLKSRKWGKTRVKKLVNKVIKK